jgi:membrane protein implicated in regulation of membrane protease activity
MPDWSIWLVVAALLAVGELLTLGLFLGLIAVAAVASGLLALAGLGLAWQLVVFIAVSVATLGLLRPVARMHLRPPRALRTGTAALVGARAVVLERVDDHGGRVKIGGEVWSARAYVEGQAFDPGTRVEVARIEGATALVYE